MALDITDKIAKLLAQAENAGTEEESTTFTEKAQQLASLYSVDLAKARHRTKAKERTVPITRTITLGVRGTKGLNTLVALFSGIASANDVTINIASNSTFVIAFGFAEDVDICEALFASLSVQMAQAAAAYRKAGKWRGEAIYRGGRFDDNGDYIPHSYRPINWLSARLDFQDGFAHRIGTRLRKARDAAREQARTADLSSSTGTAEGETAEAGTDLVLVEKREAVADFYRANSRARGSYRGGRRTQSAGSWHAGTAAGDRATLGSPTAMPGARKAVGA